MDWCPYIKETFNGFGNAMEYLGRYTHKIAISNSRILELIRRYLMHVLPAGFQKIRYYGFLNNRMKSRKLKVICKIQGGLRFKQHYAGMSMAELLKAVWNFNICVCPECGHATMKQLGRCHVPSS